MRPLVMTLIGRDRPGLVESLARVLEEYQANWEESRLCHLGGQFAGILQVRLDEAVVPDLVRSLEGLEAEGLSVEIHDDPDTPVTVPGRVYEIELTGQDRPGIVRQISSTLSRLNLNVEALDSGVRSAPWSGEPLFHATARVSLPQGVDHESVREALERLAEDMMVDIDVSAPAKGAGPGA